MNIRYRVELSEAEREDLQGMLKGGRHAAPTLKRAQILLATEAEGGRGDRQELRRERLDRHPHQAPLRGGQPGSRSS
jgi:hypothetical protein